MRSKNNIKKNTVQTKNDKAHAYNKAVKNESITIRFLQVVLTSRPFPSPLTEALPTEAAVDEDYSRCLKSALTSKVCQISAISRL